VKFSHQMLASGSPFTAVLAFDDLTALGVIRGLARAGLRVPEDCSVLGFDDVLPAEVATPAVTTIRQPLREMGLQAAKWTLQAIEEPEPVHKRAPRLHMSTPELVVRMSTVQAAR
jgi:LacI family transcriptional regulator